jgi:hypothetical protein
MRAVDSLRFVWPPLVSDAEAVAISFFALDLDEFSQLHIVEEGSQQIPFEVWMWTEHPTVNGGKDNDQWLTVRVPLSLAPPPGTPLKITLHGFLLERPLITGVGGLRIYPSRVSAGQSGS